MATTTKNEDAPVSFTVKMDIHEGQLEAFKEYGPLVFKDVQDNDPGCMRYDWLLSADGKTCHIMEAYVSSEAVLTHMSSILGPHGERLFSMCTITGIDFYTPVSDGLKEATVPFNPVFFEKFLGQ